MSDRPLTPADDDAPNAPKTSLETRPETSLDLKAVGLTYKQLAGGLPTVSATGRGHVAARLIELAREHGIEIREDADLVEILAVLQEGDEIPVEAIHAVAAVLAWIYRNRTE